MEVTILVIGLLSAGLGWLYQKAWERQERRVKKYQKIVSLLTGFMEDSRDSNKVNDVYSEIRKLWIYGPNDVVKLGQEYVDLTCMKGNDFSAKKTEEAMAKFVIAMRRDSSFWFSVFPRFNSADLDQKDIKVVIAKRDKTESLN